MNVRREALLFQEVLMGSTGTCLSPTPGIIIQNDRRSFQVRMRLLVLSVMVALGASCSVPRNYKYKTFEELILEYDLIFLGKDVKHEQSINQRSPSTRTFDIFCVLKGDGRPVSTPISLEDNNPAQCAQIVTEVGQTYIMGISRINDTAFAWSRAHSSLESVHFNYTQANIDKLMCGFQKPERPTGMKAGVTGAKACPKLTEKQMAPCSAGHPNAQGLLVTAISLLLTCVFLTR